MNSKYKLKILTIIIPFLIVPLFIWKDNLLGLMLRLPLCPFYSMYHRYCPACGSTRSVFALLNGDLLTSLHYNIMPVILLVIGLFAYIELATYCFGRHLLLLPRKSGFYITLASFIGVYVLIRNFIPFLIP